MAQVGGVAAAAVTLKKSFVEFASFDRRMTRIGITADASAEAIKATSKQIHAMAQENAVPIDQVVGGLEALVAAGRSLPDAMGFLPSVVKTAAATGAEVEDIARTAESVGTNFKITAAEMQTAFDIMAKGGKEGQFELKDMARYLPSLASAAGAVGIKGTEGLAQFVSMLQVVRKGTGTAEEAAASMNNIFTKMESEETAKKFSKFGIDLRKEMGKARKEGRNLIETFEDLAWKAVRGDLSKLPQLIGDMEFGRGIRALLTYRGEWQKMAKEVGNAAGTVAADHARVARDAQSSVDRLGNSWTRALQGTGRLLDSIGTSKALDNIGKGAERAAEGFDRLAESVNRGTVIEDWLRGMEQMQKVIDEAERVEKAKKKEAEEAALRTLKESRPAVAARSEEIFGDDRLTAGLDVQIAMREAAAKAERARQDEAFRMDLEAAQQRRRLEGEVGAAKWALDADRKNFGTRSVWGMSREKKGLARIQAAEAALAEFDQTVAALREARSQLESIAAQIGNASRVGVNGALTGYRPDHLAPILAGGASFGLSRGRGGAPVANDPWAVPTAHPLPPVRPEVDSSALDEAKGKAAEAETAIRALDMSVAPTVESGSLSSAIDLARQLKSILDGIGPAAQRAATDVRAATDAARKAAPPPAPAEAPQKSSAVRRSIDNEIRSARRNAFADTLQVT